MSSSATSGWNRAAIFKLDRRVMDAEAVLEIVLKRRENPGGAEGHGKDCAQPDRAG